MWTKFCLTLDEGLPLPLTQKTGGMVILFHLIPTLWGQGWVLASGHRGCKCFTGEMKILPSAGLGIRVQQEFLDLSLPLEQGSSLCGPVGSILSSTAPLPAFKFLKPSSCPPAFSEPHHGPVGCSSGSSSRWARPGWVCILPACPQSAVSSSAAQTSMEMLERQVSNSESRSSC